MNTVPKEVADQAINDALGHAAERIAALESELAGARFAAKSHGETAELLRKIVARMTADRPSDTGGDLFFRSRVADLLHLLPWNVEFADGDKATGESALADVRAAIPAQGARYTCKGKGGDYKFVSEALGAGASRGTTAVIYQDTDGVWYWRTASDFAERMEPTPTAAKVSA